eukprot:EG_transcript_11040
MGIQGLTKLISEKAPGAIKESEMKHYFGRRIAVDASMSIYQFLIAMKGAMGGEGELTNEEGEVTSHLQGMFSRTIRMLQLGLKPVYVFDGAAPEMKSKVLAARKEKAQEAASALEEATEDGEKEDVLKLEKRTVRATREMTEDCKKLLQLMGVPVVQAAGEAEATCAELVKRNKCWATGTEDMDALTFGTPRLLRHLTVSEAKKQPILEIHLERVLEGMEMDMAQFIDLCILLGCDYCPRITGIGPMKAYEGIKKYRNIEAFLESLDRTKYKVHDDYPFADARALFLAPPVASADDCDVNYKDPDEAGLIKFLCEEKMFSRERVERGIKKLVDCKAQKTQGRLDTFFTVQPGAGVKRKAEEAKGAAPGAKKAKLPIMSKKVPVGGKKK